MPIADWSATSQPWSAELAGLKERICKGDVPPTCVSTGNGRSGAVIIKPKPNAHIIENAASNWRRPKLQLQD
jgi:hypothetical protein